MSTMLSLVVICAFVSFVRSAEICCPDIGCFNDLPPYDGQPLPTCPADQNPPPTYTMYTRTNRNTGQVFNKNTIPPAFVGSRNTVFISHGWQSSGTSAWVPDMKNAFLDREDINVAIINWEGGANDAWYPNSAANTRTVGAEVALVMANLKTNGGSTQARMWCTGHSLGGHVCGHAGMRTPLGRATGMDPAGPWFESSSDPTVGLNPRSATLVDVIHTDTTYGTLRNLGHIDFYPNGGADQPGCGTNTCSHGRATEFFTETIRGDTCVSRSSCTNYNQIPLSCSSCTCGANPCAIMGYNADAGCSRSGLYHLTTNRDSPYCQG